MAAAVAFWPVPSAAQVISHQLFDSVTGTLRDNLTGSAGTVFQASETAGRVVTHLGYFDSGNDGLQTSHRVGLYTATPAGTGAGTLLAEVTVPAGTAAFLENGYRWVALPEPLELGPQSGYVLAAEVATGSGDPYPDAVTRVWNRYYVGYNAATSRAARSTANAWPQEPEVQGKTDAAFGAANLGLALTPRPYRIMPLGDSITAGYTDNPNWRVPFQFGYRSELFTLLTRQGIPFQFVGNSPEPWNGQFGRPTNQPVPDLRPLAQDQHEGYGGQGTAFVTQNLKTWLANDRPDVILLMIGINDIGQGQTGQPTAVQRALSNIVQTIVTQRPETHTIVAQIIPYAGYTPALHEYNDHIRDTLVPAFVARGHRVSTVDQYTHFVTDPAGLAIDPARYSNGINHPDAVAYARMAQAWFDGIQAALFGGPTVTLNTPAATQEASPGTVLTVNASTTPGAGGSAVRLELLVNGVLQLEVRGDSLTTTWQVPTPGAHRLTVRAFDAHGHSDERSVRVLGTDPTAGPAGVAEGLRVWLKAEAGVVLGPEKAVVRWQDQSGHLHDATQPSAVRQPKYVEGLFSPGPGLRFDGSRFLASTNGMPTGSYTKVVRFFISQTAAANNLLSGATAGTAAARGHGLLFGTGQKTLKLSHTGNFAVATTDSSLGRATTVLATYEATTRLGELYLDGVFAGSGIAEGDNTLASYQIGALGGTARLSGAISEVMIYDRVLTATERQAILGYFDDKYRTPFQLWQRQRFAPGDPRGAPGFDASGDGLANAVKYALGLDPLADNTGSSHLPHVRLAGQTVEVSYRRATDHPDVVCQLESSPHLRTWTRVADTSLGVAGTVDTRVYSVEVPSGTGALFLRLRVLLPE